MTSLSMPDAGVDLIAGFEGYEDGVYSDSRHFATAGYGHLLHRSLPTHDDHVAYDHRGRPFYLRLLKEDIERVAIEPMEKAIHVPLNDHEIAAYGSACFNCGPGLIYGTVGELLNAGKRRQAADFLLKWDNPPELRHRREVERALALAPVKVHMPWLTERERRWVLEYDLLTRKGQRPERRKVLRIVMHQQAVKIHAAAQHDGWEKAYRRQRYKSLEARVS